MHELAIRNQVDRINLAIDVIDRVPRLHGPSAHFKEWLKAQIIESIDYAFTEGQDKPEIPGLEVAIGLESFMRFFWLFFLGACCLFGAHSGFNGRWNLAVPENPMHRSWWLEITGSETAHPSGRFVGFPGGDMLPIPDPVITSGVLRFHSPKSGSGDPQEYVVRLTGDGIAGEMRSAKLNLKFTGTRAPELRDRDDSSWKPGKPVDLFDGKSLAGWTALIPGKALGWTVENGILKSAGHANNLISERKFWNFALHVEYRVANASNSGVGLRARYEVQILGDYGEAPNSHGSGALYSRIVPSVNAGLPADQWQTLDIRLIGRVVTVKLNGVTVIDRQTVEGPTALVMDPNEAEPGPLFLQGDHGAVEFRKVTLTPLTQSK